MNCLNHPDRESTAFCQNCGKALCTECTRTIGNTIYCEPCLAAKLAGNSQSGAYGYANPNAFGVDGTPNPYASSAPNPGLAALLGFIPGVGAMYNGQYATGVVHLAVFAVLVSLANHSDLFGFFVAGWVFYQVIEAHHTARARRDGTPLPNPFGLNEIEERLGFGRAWPNAAATSAIPPDPYAAAGTTPPPSPGQGPVPPPPYTAPWGAPGYAYAPPIPPIPPYAPPAYPDPNLVAASRNRFPAGAIWLIGFGIFFLIANSHLFSSFAVERVVPFIIIAIGVWLFVRKMTDTGAPLGDDGTPAYRMRLFRAARGSSWVILVGVLFLLDSFGILSWGHSWPLFIILAGVMTFLQRAVSNSVAAYPYPYAYPVPPAGPASNPPAASTSLTRSTHDKEGR